ncbi:DMSO/TMAO reductase YedYZ, molybdopterin-dependent catalytic subunit [Halobiforma haloterrestris]|uniref:DMSO/TMAO reductase YedYZ, molybdopterin-dependent catalytic subunit n=1 Tax=Natronobacterium haloterrestre TaxID=148448 RepID=A0A1I1DZV3_NATHA|nr:molybdopterin-dependent oxidoreductase [Halobiforma haloterrestris]SFB79922.1 DMSO/TMAO reductase YedYZ, molybdopterin-dependent catalytic subunit [Halobiforma haloterrestris]
MVDSPSTPVRSALAAVRPPPRFVDWSIFTVVVLEAVSGLVSFTVGSPAGWPLFWLHRILGLTLVALLGFKFARVRHRVLETERWRPSTLLSILTVIAATGAIATGVLWTFGLDVGLSYWTLLSVHVGFGLVLVPLMVWHLSTRFRLPKRRDFDRRRTTLEYAALLAGGALVYRTQEFLNRALETPGADRRFTGSQPREGRGNGSFPVTSWVADDPDPIDPSAWTLTIRGEVETPLEYSYDELAPTSDERALLDCTSGWYTVQRWRGIRVGDLLAAADVRDGAAFVRFVSVTGYRWSLPLEEAREALLATHVGGERLSHGHGAPMRLVAPGRRGFQWVKWLERVEVRRRSDPAQWVVTLVSGFD